MIDTRPVKGRTTVGLWLALCVVAIPAGEVLAGGRPTGQEDGDRRVDAQAPDHLREAYCR